jgi:hypothetical protein
MRTTVTLDKDVERLLRDEMHRSRQSFKQALNASVRAGLTGIVRKSNCKKFLVKARLLGLRAGIDPMSFNKLADDLEVEALLEKTRRMPK